MSGDHKAVIKHPSDYIKLNIGGSLHYTTLGTLQKHDTMLRAMFSGRMEVITDAEGWILIDRCGKHFGTILNFLRDGSVPLPESTKEMAELLAEAKYYCISELAESCEQALMKKEREAEPICRVPLITSQREEQLLISNTTKPVVKLLINRHNNKYSYTSTSDDNLLKNIELFDKMSLRFSGRVLFIKDVIGSSEICCWTFYGHGRKMAEVCCHSIVYTTDKKHTKVEFPEARIYEETLNILLYEHRNGPDQELMQATSSRGAVGVAPPCTSDEEEEADEVSPQKRHKKHKHKKHKKKKIAHDDSDSFTEIIAEVDKKKAFKVKVKKDEERSSERAREKIAKISSLTIAGPSTVPSPKATTKKKIPKNNKGKDSGTSSEEERWLDAIESGKLEEVDDELKKIKPKDPKLMTARQRAMFERKTDTEPNPGVEQLMSLPTGYKEKVMTAEAIQKAALKSLKRKQLADEKREKDKKKTMERLLKKQESKASKVVGKGKPSKRQVPLVSYRLTAEGSSISFPPGEDFPLRSRKELEPLPTHLCGVNQCNNLKKYSCSKTGVPLCSLECYKINQAIST